MDSWSFAELPLGVCRNRRACLQVGRLLIADAPGRNFVVIAVAVLQFLHYLVMGVVGGIEPAAPIAKKEGQLLPV